MKNYLFVFLLAVSFLGNAQQSETSKVIATAENYFYGYIERDGVKLNKAFDTKNGTMKIPEKSGSTITGYKNSYFKEIIPKWANRAKLSKVELENCNLEILNITVESNQMATVKLKMVVGDKKYIDLLSLQKINGQWKITNKMYIEF